MVKLKHVKETSFAEKHMQKHGWTKGKGLGKNEDGISEPIKVKIKSDTAGVGHDPSEQFTYHWWEHAFMTAAANISVQEDQDDIKVTVKGQSMIASTKRSAYKKTVSTVEQKPLYGNFIKCAVLDNGILQESNSQCDSSSDEPVDDFLKHGLVADEALLRICDGRTAHKGARHGLKQSAKLARLEEHERSHLSLQCNKVHSDTSSNIPSADSQKTKKKKFKSRKRKRLLNRTDEHNKNSCCNSNEGCSINCHAVPKKQFDKQNDKKIKKKTKCKNITY